MIDFVTNFWGPLLAIVTTAAFLALYKKQFVSALVVLAVGALGLWVANDSLNLAELYKNSDAGVGALRSVMESTVT